MRPKLRHLLLSVAIFLGLSMTAFASSLTLTLTASGATSNGAVYFGTLSGKTDPAVEFICDNYLNPIKVGESWQVSAFNIQNLASEGAPTGKGKLGRPGFYFTATSGHSLENLYSGMSELQEYAEAIWIAQSLFGNPKTPTLQATTDSFAIWTLLDHGVRSDWPLSITSGGKGSLTIWGELANAAAWWNNTCSTDETACLKGLSNVAIYLQEPLNCGKNRPCVQPQEFFAYTPTHSTVPEPVSLILMGSFLTLAGGLTTRRRRRS